MLNVFCAVQRLTIQIVKLLTLKLFERFCVNALLSRYILRKGWTVLKGLFKGIFIPYSRMGITAMQVIDREAVGLPRRLWHGKRDFKFLPMDMQTCFNRNTI